MGRTAAAALKNAPDILWAKARCYASRPKYPQLIVFSKWKSELDLLVFEYGGNYYKHGSGYVWSTSEHDILIKIVHSLANRLPSKNGFEKLIIETFPQEIKNDAL